MGDRGREGRGWRGSCHIHWSEWQQLCMCADTQQYCHPYVHTAAVAVFFFPFHPVFHSYGQEAAAQIATELPQLLQYKPKTLDVKTAVLAEGLGLGLSEGLQVAKAMVRREPRLLTHAAAVLEQRLQGLGELLGLSSGKELSDVVSRRPSLLHKKTETLEGEYGITVPCTLCTLGFTLLVCVGFGRERGI